MARFFNFHWKDWWCMEKTYFLWRDTNITKCFLYLFIAGVFEEFYLGKWLEKWSPNRFFHKQPKREHPMQTPPVDLLTPDGGTKVEAWNATSAKNTCRECGNFGGQSLEPAEKKSRRFSMKYWLFNRGSLWLMTFSYPNWVVVHPLYTLNNQGFFHYCSNNFTRNVKVQKYCSWFGKGKLGGGSDG